MNQVSDNTPALASLFAFYKETVKPLYAAIQIDGSLPVEVLFEINAAMDHVSRVFTEDQETEKAIDCAKRHLKRSCLDIFKLTVKSAHDQYDELNRMRGLVYLDNGDFQVRMRQAWEEIRAKSIEARRSEGSDAHTDNDEVPSFEKWQNVFALCEEFRVTFYNHPGKKWASRQAIWDQWKVLLLGGFIGAIVGYLLSFLSGALARLFGC